MATRRLPRESEPARGVSRASHPQGYRPRVDGGQMEAEEGLEGGWKGLRSEGRKGSSQAKGEKEANEGPFIKLEKLAGARVLEGCLCARTVNSVLAGNTIQTALTAYRVWALSADVEEYGCKGILGVPLCCTPGRKGVLGAPLLPDGISKKEIPSTLGFWRSFQTLSVFNPKLSDQPQNPGRWSRGGCARSKG